jgi:long-chain acyl-CoA synthetase
MDERPWLKNYPKEIPATIKYPDVPLQELLASAARDFPERVCLRMKERKVTYRELEQLTDAIAGNLAGLGRWDCSCPTCRSL